MNERGIIAAPAGCGASHELQLSEQDSAALVATAKALADPVRLHIVDVIRRNGAPVCVCDLLPLFEVTQPTLSHHLKRLREAGLVTVERRQQWAYYDVAPGPMEALTRWLD